MIKFSNHPQTISELIIETLRLYQYTFQRFFFFMIAIAFFSALPALLRAHFTMGDLTELLLYLLATIPTILLEAFLLLKLCSELNQQWHTNFQLIDHLKRRAATLILAIFLYYCLVGVGLILLLIPGFFLLTLFFFAWVFITLENDEILPAFRHSYHLVIKYWWRVFAMILFFTAINFAIAMSLTGIVVFVGNFFFNIILHLQFTDAETLNNFVPMFLWIIAFGVGIIVAPIHVCFTLVVFHDLKLRQSSALRKLDNDEISMVV